MLKAGEKAPAFKLNDQNGRPVSLSDFAGRKVVLYFYPKDNTPGCTAQACGFGELPLRDFTENFRKGMWR